MRLWGLAAAVWVGAGCPAVVVPSAREPVVETPPCQGVTEQVDVFTLAGAAKVDVLLVVDTAAEMGALLPQVPARLAGLLEPLLKPEKTVGGVVVPLAPPDFHVAVAPTNLGGDLLPFPQGGVPLGCNATDLDVDPVAPRSADGGVLDGGAFRPSSGACEGCVRYLARAQCACPGRLACANLFSALPSMVSAMTVNPSGAVASHTPVTTLRAALGVVPMCGSDQTLTDPPAVNAGFYRDDAALVVVFLVNGEDDSLSSNNPLAPSHYDTLVRQVRHLKGPGREDLVKVVTLSGLCRTDAQCTSGRSLRDILGATNAPDPSRFCEELHADAGVLACGRPLMGGEHNPLLDLGGCDPCAVMPRPAGCSATPDAGTALAPLTPAPQLMALACDTGGVFYNACASDWSSIISGRTAAALSVRGAQLNLSRMPSGGVTVSRLGSGGTLVQLAASDVEVTGQDVRLATVLPAGTMLRVRYAVEGARCCAGGCQADEVCNSQGLCQAFRCGPSYQCPGEATFCDSERTQCVAAGECTLDEHCPLGATCECGTRKCVAAPACGG